MAETVVFIPAWNEEANLPAVLGALHVRLPDVDVLVVDDGSTDRTAKVAREHGAEVLSLGVNLGLRIGIAAGYRWALEHGYRYCGRVDADGQHPPEELARLLALVQEDRCDVAVGSRFVSGDGYAPYRYRPSAARRLGTGLLRRSVSIVLRQPFADATSGMYAVNDKSMPLLASPYTSGAPEVEVVHWFWQRPQEPVSVRCGAGEREALERELIARLGAARVRGFAVSSQPHRGLCRPGRRPPAPAE